MLIDMTDVFLLTAKRLMKDSEFSFIMLRGLILNLVKMLFFHM